jgi:UTP--glucose-1-phosphate uridylyltransferase
LLREMISLYKELNTPILALEKVPMENIHKYGVIDGTKEKDNVYRINDLVEKPSQESAPSDMAIIGRYILTADIFEALEGVGPGKGGEIQLTDALRGLLKKRQIYGYLFTGKRYDAGDKLGYLKATVDLALKNLKVSSQFKEYIIDVAKKIKN